MKFVKTDKGEKGRSNRIDKQMRMYDDVRPLAEELKRGAPIDFSKDDEKRWVLAFDLLIVEGDLDEAQAIIDPMYAHFSSSTYLRHMRTTFKHLPPAVADDPDFASFRDQVDAEVQVVPREGATTLVLGFCGNGGKMGVQVNLQHRLFGPAKVHVIYLRDLVTKMYVHGVSSLGEDFDATVVELKRIIDQLGPKRVVCQGHSGGGYAALRYGLALQVDEVLTFGGRTDPFWEADEKVLRMAARYGVTEGGSMRPLYDSAARVPKVRLIYSENNAYDAGQAKLMEGAPGVTLEPVLGRDQHGAFIPLMENGRYEVLLRELVDPQPALAEA